MAEAGDKPKIGDDPETDWLMPNPFVVGTVLLVLLGTLGFAFRDFFNLHGQRDPALFQAVEDIIKRVAASVQNATGYPLTAFDGNMK